MTGPPRRPAAALARWWPLALVVAGGLALQVLCALSWGLGFDETWHVYYGRVDDFRFFLREIRHDTHPPLTYLLLRFLARIGGSPLWPRLSSILPAAGSIVLVYAVARALGTSRAVALLGSFLLAVSHSFVSMAVSVRSYSMAAFFTLAVLLVAVSSLRRGAPPARPALLAAALCAVLAVWSHYAAALALLSILAACGLAAMTRPAHTRELLASLAARPPWLEASVVLAGLAGVVAWRLWTRTPLLAWHLAEFLHAPGEDAAAFLWRGVLGNLRSFAPFSLGEGPLALPALALLVALWLLLASLHLRPGSPRWDPSRGAVLLAPVLLAAALAVLGLLGRYPWGGFLRHQFVLFPFLLLPLVLALDLAWGALGGRAARALLAACVLLAGGANAVVSFRGPHADDFGHRSAWADALPALTPHLREGDVLFVGRFDAINVFGLARHRPWRRVGVHPGIGHVLHAGPEGPPPVVAAGRVFFWPEAPDEGLLADLTTLTQSLEGGRVWVGILPQSASLVPDADAWRRALEEEAERAGLDLQAGPPLREGLLLGLAAR